MLQPFIPMFYRAIDVAKDVFRISSATLHVAIHVPQYYGVIEQMLHETWVTTWVVLCFISYFFMLQSV
jgi:hypothetical protein